MKKIMPTRSSRDMSMIVDLDDLVSRSVGFVFRGKTYEVNSVSTEKFIEISEILSEVGMLLQASKNGESINQAQIYETYKKFISVLVPKFTIDILKEMQLPQVHALVNLIIKHATGQPMNIDQVTEKKKLNLSLGI